MGKVTESPVRRLRAGQKKSFHYKMETSVFEGKQSLPSYNLPEVVIQFVAGLPQLKRTSKGKRATSRGLEIRKQKGPSSHFLPNEMNAEFFSYNEKFRVKPCLIKNILFQRDTVVNSGCGFTYDLADA